MSHEHIIGVDLGGTQIRAAKADREGTILNHARRLTLAPEGPKAGLGRMREAIREALGSAGWDTVLGIGIAAPGPLDLKMGTIIRGINLPGWDNVPIRDIIAREFGVPVYLNNDANLAALAEHRFGAGRGCSDVVYLTVSTGIGGGIIIAGKMLLGAHGWGGEPGHTIVEPAGPPCTCGSVGCLEAMSSGPAIAQRAAELIRQGHASSLSEAVQVGTELTAEMVGEAALQGDQLALQIIGRAAYYLGIGVVNLINIFDPNVVILGGGVSKLGALLFDPVRAMVRKRTLTETQRDTPIVPAALGDQVGVLGGVALVVTEQLEQGSR